MKIFLLTPRDGIKLWEPWYDKAFEFVVIAKDEAAAREYAAEDCGDEGPEAWTDPKNSDCIVLKTRGEGKHEPGVVIRDYAGT